MAQAKGGSFVGDNKDFYRFRLGEHTVIPAFEEAVETMKVSSGPLPIQWVPLPCQVNSDACMHAAQCFLRPVMLNLTCSLLSMREAVQVGGVRRIIVPVELGYPNNDMNSLGPKPLTFSVRLKAFKS